MPTGSAFVTSKSVPTEVSHTLFVTGPDATRRYPRPVDRMPEPGDVSPGFIAEAGRCWRMLYDKQLQATHCDERPRWTGRWFSPRGNRWFRVWACPDHLDGLTGLRQYEERRRLED